MRMSRGSLTQDTDASLKKTLESRDAREALSLRTSAPGMVLEGRLLAEEGGADGEKTEYSGGRRTGRKLPILCTTLIVWIRITEQVETKM